MDDMAWVIMRKMGAGPQGNMLPGARVLVSRQQGEELVAGRYADWERAVVAGSEAATAVEPKKGAGKPAQKRARRTKKG